MKGACSNMSVPLKSWVEKGGQSVLNFKFNDVIHSDFFAFFQVGYITQECFFVMWQIEGRRFWFGAYVGYL